MASTSPSTRHAKNHARRSIPVPAIRSSSTQRNSQGASSTSAIEADQCFTATATPGSKTNFPKPPPISSHSATSSRSSIGKPCIPPPTKIGSNASTLILRTSNLYQAKAPCRPSTATGPSGTTRSFSTPTNQGPSLLPRNIDLATPKGPRQHLRTKTSAITPAQTPSKTATSPYMNTHIADPCIPNCLVHQLSPCGHKVMTATPEPCAKNCRRPLLSQGSPSPYVSILQSTEPFVCAACVVLHTQSHREMKRALFTERMNRTELQMGGFPTGWREEQNEYWERVWDNDMLRERGEFEQLGRKCLYIPGEPMREGEAGCVSVPISFAKPWPPLKRPLAERRVGGDGLVVNGG